MNTIIVQTYTGGSFRCNCRRYNHITFIIQRLVIIILFYIEPFVVERCAIIYSDIVFIRIIYDIVRINGLINSSCAGIGLYQIILAQIYCVLLIDKYGINRTILRHPLGIDRCGFFQRAFKHKLFKIFICDFIASAVFVIDRLRRRISVFRHIPAREIIAITLHIIVFSLFGFLDCFTDKEEL